LTGRSSEYDSIDKLLGIYGTGGHTLTLCHRLSNHNTVDYECQSDEFTPVLYDLSYLTKPIEHEGEMFVPIKRIYEVNGWEWDDEEGNDIDEIGICSDLNILTYATAQLLLSWHFNIFSLPESEYINKATLTTNK
jgi:hypothetical protein